jgi:pimeloyl-ACP methyl ester carboxylesterase
MAVSVVASVARRRRVIVSPHLVSSSGNRLGFDLALGDATKPLIVFENGLLGLPEHYAWIRRFLGAEGYSTATYSRAGYGASILLRTGRPYRIDDSVDDLVSVVNELSGEHSSVILVGHSIGAEIVRRLVLEHQTAVPIAGVVYLDPTHPDQLARSAAQASTVKDFTDNLKSFHVTTALTLGTFLSRPAWILTLPVSARRQALDQFRDHRLWGTAFREWNTMTAELADGRSVEVNDRVDALLVSAGRTLSGDAAIDDLHGDILAAHEKGGRVAQRVVVDDVTHDSLLTNASHARMTADAVLEFLAQRPGEPGGVEESAATTSTRRSIS